MSSEIYEVYRDYLEECNAANIELTSSEIAEFEKVLGIELQSEKS